MHQFVAWLSSNAAALGILGAAVAFIWSTIQQVTQRKAEARERAFQAFHKLVKELSQPEDGRVWIERLCAVVFELRNFPLYYRIHGTYVHKLQETNGHRPRPKLAWTTCH
ncbi:exported hypothetical protein [Candidatus Sulfotelmatobacter sp. SbA7]|nr:exported hypothetical protein [Candidatus Sulfotelmatobacter sp. SbA7]